MDLNDKNYFCVTSSSIWQFVGYILFALKIIIPLIIIILGVIDFVNATVSHKDDAIPAAAKGLLLRLIIGIAIFFVPVIVSLVLNLIENASSAVAAADACQKCLLRPFTGDCSSYVSEAKSIRESESDKLDGNLHNDSDYVTKKEQCYYCVNEKKYVWAVNPGCQNSQSVSRYTTRSQCESSQNLTDMPNVVGKQEEEEDDSVSYSGGSSSGGNSNSGSNSNSNTSAKTAIYVGDSLLSGICQSNSLSNCYTCSNGGLSWLNGDTSKCSNASKTIVNDVAEKYNGQKYTIVVYLGTFDAMENGAGTSLASKLVNLANNEWKYSKIVAVSLLPIEYSPNRYGITSSQITKFNSDLQNTIKAARVSDKVSYCNLGFKSNDLINNYTDSLHLDSAGYKSVYSSLANCL